MSSDLQLEKNHALNEFQKEEEEQYIYYNCDRCEEKHPVGEHPHKDGDK